MASYNSKQVREIAKTSISSAMTEKELRDQLHQEIEKKSRACSNPTYMCSLPRLDGYDYCLKHILRDASAPYRQCTFMYTNGRKCLNAVLKHDIKKDPALTTLCFEHSRQAQLRKTRTVIGKLMNVDSNELHLHNLAHHVKVDETAKRATQSEQEEEIDVVSPFVPPFLSYEKTQDLQSVSLAMKKQRRILDYASDSSSNEEPPCFNNTAAYHDLEESDAESVDDDDCLKYAGIFTREEVVRITKNKLMKLQSLYIDQLSFLHHTLKEKRRRYLHDVRKEREVYCSIHDQVKDSPKETQLYDELKALNSYHRRHGVEAILYKKFKEKRTRTSDGYVPKGPGISKCIYTEGGVKCGERAMPCCKYCRKHILEDKKQCLFRACSVEKSGITCKEPIPCISDDATCVLHIFLPPKRQYIQKKFESETEEEDLTVKAEPDVKSELIVKKERDRVSRRSAAPAHTSTAARLHPTIDENGDEPMDIKPPLLDLDRSRLNELQQAKKSLVSSKEATSAIKSRAIETKVSALEAKEMRRQTELKAPKEAAKVSSSLASAYDTEAPTTSKLAKAACEVATKRVPPQAQERLVKEPIVINSNRKRTIRRVSVVKRDELAKKVPPLKRMQPVVALKKPVVDPKPLKRQRIKFLIDRKKPNRPGGGRMKALPNPKMPNSMTEPPQPEQHQHQHQQQQSQPIGPVTADTPKNSTA